MTQTMEEAYAKYPHFRNYLDELRKDRDEPVWVIDLDRSMRANKNPNYLYPVGDPIFIHIWKDIEKSLPSRQNP